MDKLSTVRIGSARYSVPKRLKGRKVEVQAGEGRIRVLDGDEIVADHAVVAPGEASICDEHYGNVRPDRPRRAPRARTAAEKKVLSIRALPPRRS